MERVIVNFLRVCRKLKVDYGLITLVEHKLATHVLEYYGNSHKQLDCLGPVRKISYFKK
jgi:hypothetical protein